MFRYFRKHILEHLNRKPAGVRVVSGAMIAVEQRQAIIKPVNRAMGKFAGRLAISQSGQNVVMGNAPERQYC